MPTPTNTAGSSDVFFTDSFETGKLSAWTGSSTDTGDLSVATSAALVGSQGLQALIDGTSWTESNWFILTDASHAIELDWRAANTVGANDGGLQANLTAMENDTRRMDRIWLGAAASIDADTSGPYFFDAFESRRQTYIGP